VSLPTLLGFLAGILLLVGSVALTANNIWTFLSGSSMLIVAGGTIAAAFISYEARYVMLAFRQVGLLVLSPRAGRDDLPDVTARIIEWGLVVKKGGIVALENQIKSVKDPDPFLVYGVDLLVAGYRPDELRSMLDNVVDTTFERQMVPVGVLKMMGNAAPAFGMVGTLIGLIVMLESMGGDASAMGMGLAVALVTTLYGVLLSRLALLPAASKAQQRFEIERFKNSLMAEGFHLLAEERSPAFIADRMNGYLSPTIRVQRKAAQAGQA